MKIKNLDSIDGFLSAVAKCDGDVWLISKEGDKISLKSRLSRYIAIGALLGDEGEELELWCSCKTDEHNFFEFFDEMPEVLN